MAHEIAQFQIIPVEDGYFIQVINADGSGQKNPRHVATTREELVRKIKMLADNLFTKEPPPPPAQAGPAGAAGAMQIPPPRTPPPPESAPSGTA